MTANHAMLPLCVDLDGTLIRTDLLLETLLQTLKRAPWRVLLLGIWLLRGKAYFKRRLAEEGPVCAAALPYHEEFLSWLRRQHAAGRKIVLATASHRKLAEAVAAHLQLFSDVIATEDGINLKGTAKLAALCHRFPDGFAYAGNSKADLVIWRQAGEAILVNASPGLERRARQEGNVAGWFPGARLRAKAFLKALRVHQWAKNGLIFLPALLSHRFLEPEVIVGPLLAFFAFSLTASGVYLWNDLLDLAEDRRHPMKKRRPLASGSMPLGWAMGLAPLLVASGMGLAALIPARVTTLLAAYLALNAFYSLWLKGKILMDVFVLAGFYTLRLGVGYVAGGLAYSAWLLSLSVFLFLSLAFAKRVSELRALEQKGETEVPGRGYQVSDLPQLTIFGISTATAASMVLTLYIDSQSSRELYHHPRLLWLTFPLFLYWLTRIWLMAGRGNLQHDPVIFALRDSVTYLVSGLIFALGVLASTPWLDWLLAD